MLWRSFEAAYDMQQATEKPVQSISGIFGSTAVKTNLVILQRRAWDRDQRVHWEGFWVFWHAIHDPVRILSVPLRGDIPSDSPRHFPDQTDAIVIRFSES